MADLHQRVESLFDKTVSRVVLERIDGELTVVEVDFEPGTPRPEVQQPGVPLLPLNVRARR